jgi:hypothetical protein
VCKDKDCITYEQKKPKKIVRMGLEAGSGFSKMEFDVHPDLSTQNIFFVTTSTMHFSVDGFAETNMDENYRLFLRFTGGFRTYKFENPSVLIENYSSTGSISYSFSSVMSSVSLRYHIDFGKMSPFLSFGIPIGFILQEKGNYHHDSPEVNQEQDRAFTTAGFYNESKDKIIYGTNGGLGLEYAIPHQRKVYVSCGLEKIFTSRSIMINTVNFKLGVQF